MARIASSEISPFLAPPVSLFSGFCRVGGGAFVRGFGPCMIGRACPASWPWGLAPCCSTGGASLGEVTHQSCWPWSQLSTGGKQPDCWTSGHG
eukprot:1238879-Amphidinium_carterae.2